MYYKLLEKFLQFFAVTSYHYKRDNIPLGISPTELSIVSTQLGKEIDYYNNVIKLSNFDSTLSNATQSTIKQSNTSLKSILQLFEVSNPYKISDQQVSNLLKSFAFNFFALPDIKRQVLQKLVHTYKNKGTKSIEDFLNIFIPNLHLTELLFVNDDPYFTGKINVTTSVKDTCCLELKFPYVTDKYWKLSLEEAQNYPYNYAMSPYYAQSSFIDLDENLQALIRLRTLAKHDYDVWISNPQDYNEQKILKIDPFPENLSYLDVYMFLKYCISKIKFTNVYDSAHTNYMYYKDDTSTLPKDFKEAFKRDTNPTSWNINVKFKDIKVEPILIIPDSQISQFSDYVLDTDVDEFNIANNDRYSVIYVVKNEIANIYILDYNNPFIHINISFPDNAIHKPLLLLSDHEVHIYGGYTSDNKHSDYEYIINLKTKIAKKQHIKFWFSNGCTINRHDKSYVISRDGACSGCIYKYDRDFFQVAKLSSDLDHSTIVAEPYMNNKIVIFALDKKISDTKILLLDEGNYFLTDLTCILLQQSNAYQNYRIFMALKNNNLKVICNGDKINLFDGMGYMAQISLNYKYGEKHNRILSKNVSPIIQDSFKGYQTDDNTQIVIPNVTYNSQFGNKNVCVNFGKNYDCGEGYYRLFINRIVDQEVYPFWPYSFACNACNTAALSFIPTLKSLHYDLFRFDIIEAEQSICDFVSRYNMMINYDSYSGDTFHYVYEFKINSYCSVFYDGNAIYDKTKQYLILLNRLPYYGGPTAVSRYDDRLDFDVPTQEYIKENPEFFNNKPKDKSINTPLSAKDDVFDETLYKVEELPDYITLTEDTLTVTTPEVTKADYVISYNDSLYTSFRLTNSKELRISIYYPYLKYKKVTIDYDLSYSCDKNNTSPLCWFENKDKFRNDTFTTKDQDLPLFSSTQQLYEFLQKISPSNLNFLDNTNNYNFTLYSLLYNVSKTISDANFLYLINFDISDIVSYIVPIHSRPLFKGYILVQDDPVLDLVPFSDNVSVKIWKCIYDSLNISDKYIESCRDFKSYLTSESKLSDSTTGKINNLPKDNMPLTDFLRENGTTSKISSFNFSTYLSGKLRHLTNNDNINYIDYHSELGKNTKSDSIFLTSNLNKVQQNILTKSTLTLGKDINILKHIQIYDDSNEKYDRNINSPIIPYFRAVNN